MATPTLATEPAAALEAHVDLSDGRRLGYTILGAPAGPLVVVLDGPASRGLAHAAAPTAAKLGIRLVAPDRPGVRGSTPAPDRGIADWPQDHAALLDELGAPCAGIFSQSGGTPYAIAAAAALPERTTAVAGVGPIAPFDERASMRELGGELQVAVRLARHAPWLLGGLLRRFAHAAAKDPAATARRAARDVPPADARALEDPAIWAIHERATTEILAQPRAIAREIGLVSRPWGVDPADVHVPVSFWSGSGDTRHPTPQARRLAARIPGDTPVHVVPDAAAFGLVAIYPQALRFAAGR
ncbi:MAG TPA: alpha/beta hydrolase [Solirubrobacteraceae bacterium]|jgi:pimeloyl-ACP methyl ester carboxylesterase|nr:alpha/beta hydrolase [Solirubrobacteraceae bacterium]